MPNPQRFPRRAFVVAVAAAVLSQAVFAKRPDPEVLYGVITRLRDGELQLIEPGTRTRRTFAIGSRVVAIPSEIGVRVGSRVRIEFRRETLLLIEVIPLEQWLELYPDSGGPETI